jgi:REP element-mobilizing transposase RayT
MQKKESYKHILPHFQQPGQAYFVTWCLKEAIPAKLVQRYSKKLELLKYQIDFHRNRDRKLPTSVKQRLQSTDPIKDLKNEYYSVRQRYFKAFDEFLGVQQFSKINLIKKENLEIMLEALYFWHNKKLKNEAFCVMPNHVHWVFTLYEKDESGKPVFLQDIMHSVKRYSANRINKSENRTGALWQKESFDTTIRDEKHMYNVIEYTLSNPVNAGLVKKWEDWTGIRTGAL